MSEPNETPPGISRLATALAKAQGEFPVIPKDSEVEVYAKGQPKTPANLLYKYKYADLTAIISATRPAFSKYGLSFTQGVVPGGFVTTFFHESGETLQSGFIPCDVPKNADMKQVAGLITYVKRISLTAALGVSADEDVDAAPVEGNQGNQTDKKPAGKAAAPAKKQETKPPAEKKPAGNLAPCDQGMIDAMNSAAADSFVTESALWDLISNGYGYNERFPPVFVIKEVIKFLESGDATADTIAKFKQNTISRREAKRIKDEQAKLAGSNG